MCDLEHYTLYNAICVAVGGGLQLTVVTSADGGSVSHVPNGTIQAGSATSDTRPTITIPSAGGGGGQGGARVDAG